MKNLFFVLTFLASAILASTPADTAWKYNTKPKSIPVVLENAPFNILAADVILAPGDTTYSQVFDTYKLPLVYIDSLGQVQKIDTTVNRPSVVVSCYDISDSAALVDSVIVTVTAQQSRFAADGVNPNLPFSAAWDSVTAVTLAAASDANALVNGVGRPALKTREHRYTRFRFANLSATSGSPLKNKPRCRAYYNWKPMLR